MFWREHVGGHRLYTQSSGPGRAEDEWTRDQDGMEEPAAQDENGTRRQYDSVEDAGVNHVGKINSKVERRRKYISKIHGNVDAVSGS